MALYSAIQKFITKNGVPVEGASCLVYVDGSTTKPTLFATRTGGTLDNPFHTNSQGNALCFVSPGRYKMVVTKDGDQVTFEGIEVGPVSLVGSFADGGTVSDPDQWFSTVNGDLWAWGGALNKTVAPGEDPTAVAGWSRIVDNSARAEILGALTDGTAPIGSVTADDVSDLIEGIADGTALIAGEDAQSIADLRGDLADGTADIGGLTSSQVAEKIEDSEEKINSIISPPYISRLYDIHPSNSGSVNHAAIQLLLDSMESSGGGYINIHEVGVYQVSNDIELRTNTGIRGFNVYRNFSTGGWCLSLADGKSVIVDGSRTGLNDITILGQANSIAPLLTFSSGGSKTGSFKNIGFNGGGVQQIDTTNAIASVFEDIILVNGLKNRTDFAEYLGAVVAGGTDNFFNRVESNATSGFAGWTNGFAAAIQLTGTNNWITDCIGELSDVGFVVSGGSKNRVTSLRADLNFGHGIVLNGGGVTFNGVDCINNANGALDDVYCGVIATNTGMTGGMKALRVLNQDKSRLLYAVDLDAIGAALNDFSVELKTVENALNYVRTNNFNPATVNVNRKVSRVNLSAGTTEINANGVNSIILTAAGACSVSSIVGGYYGQTLEIICADTDVTLVHNGASPDGIFLFSGLSYTFAASEKSITLKMIPRGASGARWVQV